MNKVLQVSMVDLEVALTLRVTDNPKKLKPLLRGLVPKHSCFYKSNLPNTNHDEKAGDQDLPILRHLAPTFNNVKISISTTVSRPNCSM